MLNNCLQEWPGISVGRFPQGFPPILQLSRGNDQYLCGNKNIHMMVVIWITPIHSSVNPSRVYSFHPKQSTKMHHGKRESHGNITNIIQKQVILQLSNQSVASRAQLNQNVIWGIISPNKS